MLVENYGLFWLRENVFWGRQNNEARILGRPKSETTSEPIDFGAQQAVYVLYDDAFNLVYIGQVGGGENDRLKSRLKGHTRNHLAARWSRFSWFGIRAVRQNGELWAEKTAINAPVGSVLDHIEAILISAAEPPLNRQGGAFGTDVEQYLQVRDPRLGPTSEEMLRKLYESSSE